MLSKVSKFWLLLLIISAIVWLGAINVRFIIGNELLNYDEFSFRTSIPPDEENMIFKLISNASIIIIIAYIFTLLFYSEPPNHDELLMIFGERLGFLKGVPWIAILSYYTIIGIAIFKPLKKTQKELDEDKDKTNEHSYKYYLHEDDDIITD